MEKTQDIFKQFIDNVLPYFEAAEVMGLQLNENKDCPPRRWSEKYSIQISAILESGYNQLVLIHRPYWLTENLKDFPSIEEMLSIEKVEVINAIKVVDHILAEQSLRSYERGDYNLCALGLSVLLEDFITEAVGKKNTKDIRVKNHANTLVKKYKSEHHTFDQDIEEMCLIVTLKEALEKYTANSNFDEDEPRIINRHWLAHGRTTRIYTEEECIKLMSMIVGVKRL